MLHMDELAPEALHPISRAIYDRMVAAGLLDDARVELLHGLLVTMSPQGAPHSSAVCTLNDLLHPLLRKRAVLRSHSPLALGDDSEPEPDFAIVPLGDYAKAHPTGALLVVEVSDSSLRRDQRVKAPLYAAHGIPEYWIVNLVEGTLEVHTDPGKDGYAMRRTLRAGETLTLTSFPDVSVDISAVLPRPAG